MKIQQDVHLKNINIKTASCATAAALLHTGGFAERKCASVNR